MRRTRLDTPVTRPGHRRRARHRLRSAWGSDKLAVELFGKIVEPHLLQPTFVCDYRRSPAAGPSAPRQPGLIEAWDLIVGGMERGTGFSELIGGDQRERFTEQSLLAAKGTLRRCSWTRTSSNALEFGAPPMGGMGMGVDPGDHAVANKGIRETISSRCSSRRAEAGRSRPGTVQRVGPGVPRAGPALLPEGRDAEQAIKTMAISMFQLPRPVITGRDARRRGQVPDHQQATPSSKGIPGRSGRPTHARW